MQANINNQSSITMQAMNESSNAIWIMWEWIWIAARAAAPSRIAASTVPAAAPFENYVVAWWWRPRPCHLLGLSRWCVGVLWPLWPELAKRTRATLLTARMPTKYRKHAMKFSIYSLWFISRSPSKALEDKRMSPDEAWQGKKSHLAGVHILGSKNTSFIRKSLRDNIFSPNGQSLTFVGTSDNHKG